MYQVFAYYYRTGNEFPVRKPHETEDGAQFHVAIARAALTPKEENIFGYCYRRI